MKVLIFNGTSVIDVAVENTTEIPSETIFKEIVEGDSELLLRYTIVDDAIVDIYPDLTDEEVLAKVLADNEELAAKDLADFEAFEKRSRLEAVSTISRAQAKLALLELGLLSTVNDFVASSGNEELKIEWDERLEFKRDNIVLVSLAKQLNITEEALDDMFLLASTK